MELMVYRFQGTRPFTRRAKRKARGKVYGEGQLPEPQKQKLPEPIADAPKHTNQSTWKGFCKGRGGDAGGQPTGSGQKKTPEWPITATRGFLKVSLL